MAGPKSVVIVLSALASLTCLPRAMRAQVAPSDSTAASPERPRDAVVLNPFVVNSTGNVGYQAADSLAGSRLNAPLLDTPAAVSVFTKEFIQDIGATNVMQAVGYALNGGQDATDYQGTVAADRTDGLIKIRGFSGGASGTLLRDFFPFDRSEDVFNMERLDFARGPNSVLFGIGTTGGVVSATTKQANLGHTATEVELRVGSWDDYRGTLDVNLPVGDKLAVRVNGVYDDSKSYREFAFMKEKGAALAITYQPFKNTQIRLQSEFVEKRQNVAYPWGPGDEASPWLNAGKPIAAKNTPVTGTASSTSRYLVDDPSSSLGPVSYFGTQYTKKPGTSTPASAAQGPAFFNFDIIPRSANLMGPGQTTNNHYTDSSAFIDQKAGPFNFELAYNTDVSRRMIDAVLPTAANALRADPNGLLPNGQPNPNAGRFFVEGQPSISPLNQRYDNTHLTGSVDVDLNKYFLGKHTLAFLLSREQQIQNFWFYYDVNTTPAGNATYPASLVNVNDGIYYRTYLDFGSGNPSGRGAIDPFKNPIVNVNGVTSAYAAINAPALTNVINEAVMVADQAAFFNDRLHVTAGVRRDEQASSIPSTYYRDPVTSVWVAPTAWSTNRNSGNTTTIGTVLRVIPSVSVFFNVADNFSPQAAYGPDTLPIGSRTGHGDDFGAKFSLLDGRVFATVTHYELKQNNFAGLSGPSLIALTGVVNDIWNALVQPARLLTVNTRTDTANQVGKGWELDLTTNLTPQWRLGLNFTASDLVQSNALPRFTAYAAANNALWTANAATVLPTPSVQENPSNLTVGGAIQTLNTIIGNQERANGQEPYQFYKDSANLFTAYTLPKDTWLVGPLTVGGGVNFRTGWVTGYNTATSRPIWGPSNTVVNAMVSRSWNLKGRARLRVQFNLQNAFANDAILITDQDQNSQYRYIFQNPRSWSLSTTLDF